MRSETGLAAGRSPRVLGRWLALLMAAASLLCLAQPAFASTSKKAAKEAAYLPFKNCPIWQAVACAVSTTTSGEFIIGKKTVPISKPVLLQGGLAGASILVPDSLLAAVNGAETFQKVALEVPGGLTGLPLGLGASNEVSATAELAGPVSSVVLNGVALQGRRDETAVTLPIKVHLQNELLGEDCYVGSNAEPIVLHLTTGTTDPPAGTTPISGGWEGIEYPATQPIIKMTGVKLVDNDFAVPGATGCGPEALSSVTDEVIDTDIGLPAAAGSNTAILIGTVEQTEVLYAKKYVKKYVPKEKKAKK